jgi:hypothetical protein
MLSNFNIKPQKGSGLSVSVASMGILSFQKVYNRKKFDLKVRNITNKNLLKQQL